MDFLQAIEDLKAKETKLANEKNELKDTALNQVKDLVKIFGFKPEEIFGFSTQNTLGTPAQKEPKIDYAGLGFVVGETYSDGTNSCVFAEKGQRPRWLKLAIDSGKKASDLKGVQSDD